MGGIWQAQSAFTRGELDPKLVGRIDLDAYYKGVSEATNVLAIPQGGMVKRPGMEYLDTIPFFGRLESFSFSTEQNYLMVFTGFRVYIFKDGVKQEPINGGFDYLPTTINEASVKEMDYIQSADSIIITHPDIAPQFIQRTSDTSWTIVDLPIINIPKFDFDDASSPAPTSEIQRIDFNNNWNDGDTFKIALDGILTEEMVMNQADTADMADQMESQLQRLPNTGSTGVSVSVFNAGALQFDFTFSGASAEPYPLMVVQSITAASGDPTNNKATTSRLQTGVSRSEDVWSSTRGWPRTCTFHESRLWFGGSRSRPSTIWGSNVNQPFNFESGRARDDEAIDVTLATDQINAVTGIISNRTLQVFTTGAEFYVPVSPITPEKVAVKPQTNLGSKRVRPVVMEGTTVFLQRTGRALFQFQFINEFQSNEARSLSILSPHLINDPTQMAVRRGAPTSDANYLYMVGNDGNMTVFNSNVIEGVQAFTNWENSGSITSVAVVDDKVYTMTLRDINGQEVYHLERENLEIYTDSATVEDVGGSDTLTGLDHLNFETVEVRADGIVMSDEVVMGGQITINRTAQTIEAGLKYRPKIVTMPFNINLNNGPQAAQKKRIARVAIHLFESNGVIVNDSLLADKTIGQNQFDAPEPQTGFKRIYLHGWSLEAAVTVEQETPMPFTVLALDLEVKT